MGATLSWFRNSKKIKLKRPISITLSATHSIINSQANSCLNHNHKSPSKQRRKQGELKGKKR